MAYKKVRGNGKPISLPQRNNFGQLDYRVQVSKELHDAANAMYATAKADGSCKNKTAPAYHDEERDIYTVTVRASQTGMYPAGVTRNAICRVTVQIGTDGYHKTIASATEEVAEKNAEIAIEKMELIREAIEERDFEEKITGINAKLSEMAKLAGKSGIPLGDLMSADKLISDEKERAATAKKAVAKKGSSMRSSAVAKENAKPGTVVTLTTKIIEKWEGLSDDELQEAQKDYAEITGADLADIVEAWQLALAEKD